MRAAAILCVLAAPAMAQHAPGPSPYAGEEGRAIAALSPEDVAEIEAGAGWGLARSAELNGWPGPTHLLELADDLGLSAAQRDGIEAIRASMNADARAIGAELIAAEAALDEAFEARTVDAGTLPALVAAAEDARGRLRARHLAAHLEAAPILTRHQRMTYDRLRGYAAEGEGSAAGHGGH